MVDGPNFPIIFQQAGAVSKVQDVAQRAGDVQQATAGAEVAAEQERQKSQVQTTQESDAHNRVRSDQQRERDRREGKGKRRRRGGRQGQEDEEQGADSNGPGRFVDVVI